MTSIVEEKVNFVFKCYKKQSEDLKIRLRYDQLQQTDFFCSLLEMYLEKDPLMMTIVEKIKSNRTSMGKSKLKRTKEDLETGRRLLSELGITKSDKSRLFDIIEMEDYE